MDILKKAADFVWDSTIGLLRQYQDKSIQLAKIEAVSFYVKSVKMLRRQIFVILLVMGALVMLALGLLVVPIVLILCMPWSLMVKAMTIFLFGALYVAVPGTFLWVALSEKKWMEFSMADKWMAEVTNHKS